jgi:hypothetical protein
MSKLIKNCLQFYSNNKIYFDVFIFFWAWFALTNNGWDNSEGSQAYLVAEQIVKHGKLGFDEPPEYLFNVAPNGRSYLAHEFGNVAFMLPTAFVNVLLENTFSRFVSQDKIELVQGFTLSFQAGVYSALTATLFFATLHTGFSKSKVTSFVATLCLAFTTYFWTYTRSLYDGVLCTTIIMLSFFLLLKYRREGRLEYVLYCFITLGFGLITRLSMLFPVVVSLGYLVSIHKLTFKSAKVVFLGLGTLLPFVMWQAWYNYLRTGIFYKSPVQTDIYAGNNGLDGNIFVGLTGLLFSPGKSIFVYAPLLILSVLLFKRFYKEHQKEAIYTAALAVLWFLLHSRLRSWYGAAGWGPRHFITILPILFLPLAVNLEYVLKKTAWKISAILLGSFGFILALSSIISNWLFRMTYATERGLDSDNIFVWGFWNSQPMDMLQGTLGNIVRLLTNAPIITLPNYSEANAYASSTIYVWANSFIYGGIPWYFVMLLVSPLLFLIYWSGNNILHSQAAPRANWKVR